MIKVLVDAGHGSNTAGKRTAPFLKNVDIDGDGKIDVKKGEQYHEHYANVMVAGFLYEELKRCNVFEVYKSAWDDADASDDEDTALSKRQKIAIDNAIPYTISCHFNASGSGAVFNNADGFAIYVHDTNIGDSMKMAQIISTELEAGTKQLNRGIWKDGLAMCNCKTMGTKASILLELAFMTNERDAEELMANEKFCRECAVEVAKGLCKYLRVTYIPQPIVSVREDVVYRVQCGAFTDKKNADKLKVKLDAFKPFVTKVGTMYKVQVGAYSIKKNAELLVDKLKKLGYEAIIVKETK